MNVELDLKLIREVKLHPMLYDKFHPKYNDLNLREVVWHKIGDLIQRPVLECKLRWSNIRDSHRSNLNPNRRNAKEYKYHNEMLFMLPVYSNESCALPEDTDKDNEDYTKNDEWEIECTEDFDESADSSQIQLKNEDADQLACKKEDEQLESSKLFEKEIFSTKNCTDINGSKVSTSCVDKFLSEIGVSLKTLSSKDFSHAKAEISKVISMYKSKKSSGKISSKKVIPKRKKNGSAM